MTDWSFKRSICALMFVITMVLQSTSVFAAPPPEDDSPDHAREYMSDDTNAHAGSSTSSSEDETDTNNKNHAHSHAFGPYATNPKYRDWSPQRNSTFLRYGAMTQPLILGTLHNNRKYYDALIVLPNELNWKNTTDERRVEIYSTMHKYYKLASKDFMELPLEKQAQYHAAFMNGEYGNPNTSFGMGSSPIHTVEQTQALNDFLAKPENAALFEPRGNFLKEITKHKRSDISEEAYLITLIHRGMINLAFGIPENSIQSMIFGKLHGFFSFEIDVMMSKDLVLWASHGRHYNSEVGAYDSPNRNIETMNSDEVYEKVGPAKVPLVISAVPKFETMVANAFQRFPDFVAIAKVFNDGTTVIADCRELSPIAFMVLAVDKPEYIPYMGAKFYKNALPGGGPQLKKLFKKKFGEDGKEKLQKFRSLKEKPAIIPIIAGSSVDITSEVFEANIEGFDMDDFEEIFEKLSFYAKGGDYDDLRNNPKNGAFFRMFEFLSVSDKELLKVQMLSFMNVRWGMSFMGDFNIVAFELSSLPPIKETLSKAIAFLDDIRQDVEITDNKVPFEIMEALYKSSNQTIIAHAKNTDPQRALVIRPLVEAIMGDIIIETLDWFAQGKIIVKVGADGHLPIAVSPEWWDSVGKMGSERHGDQIVAAFDEKDIHLINYNVTPLVVQLRFGGTAGQVSISDFARFYARTLRRFWGYTLFIKNRFQAVTTDTPFSMMGYFGNFYTKGNNLNLHVDTSYRTDVMYNAHAVEILLKGIEPSGYSTYKIAPWPDGNYMLHKNDEKTADEINAQMKVMGTDSMNVKAFNSTLNFLTYLLQLAQVGTYPPMVEAGTWKLFSPLHNSTSSIIKRTHNPFREDRAGAGRIYLPENRCNILDTHYENNIRPAIDRAIENKKTFAKKWGVSDYFWPHKWPSMNALHGMKNRARIFFADVCSYGRYSEDANTN